jgi:hypothetical protein
VPVSSLNRGTGVLGAGSQANTGMAVGVPNVAGSTAKLTFPNLPVGTPSQALTVTVTNNGAAPLQVGSAAIVAGTGGGDADQFSFSGDACSQATVPPSGTCVIAIRYKPLVSGTPVAFLRVPSNAQNGTLLVTLDPPPEDAVPAGPSGPSGPATPPPVRAALASCMHGRLGRGRITLSCTFAKAGNRTVTARLSRGGRVFASGRAKTRGSRVALRLLLRRKTKPGLYTLSLTWRRGKAHVAAVQTVLIRR